MKKGKGEICLFLAAIIWGSAFVFQKMGMDFIGPFAFGLFRFLIGGIALLPVVYVYDKTKKKKRAEIIPFKDKNLLKGSFWCGVANFIGGSLQQMGIVYTTAGKAGFITSLDIVIIPIILIIMRRKVSTSIWIGVVLACFGLYFLCITDGFTIQLGDGLVIACAFAYSGQVLLIDYYSSRTDPIKLSCLQFVLAGILSGIVAILFETIELSSVIDCALPILYTAILEVSVAFTLQILGQRYVSPAIAAIIMSMEAVFSALCGAAILHETMNGRELTGCALMFTAFIVTQIPDMIAATKKTKGN